MSSPVRSRRWLTGWNGNLLHCDGARTLVKIDVEGAEQKVLHDMASMLHRHCASLIVEIHPVQIERIGDMASGVVAFLETAGCTITPINRSDMDFDAGDVTVLAKLDSPVSDQLPGDIFGMKRLVSIVIPCYNAARWVTEAVDSCLAQTYLPIEIIVIDDGSTDDSLAIIQSFGDRIRYETGPNRGGNYARNRGFALSRGVYVQFLDADDYLLPEKLARQVAFLDETGADVVYGDWRHQFHEPDGRVWQDDVHVSGDQTDVLASLLAGWWVAPVGLLWRRRVVIASGGWDESLAAGQDRDFFISVALTGADIRYQPGCESVYRRYGNVTVSTSNRLRWLESHCAILEKAQDSLIAQDRWSEHYQRAVARSWFHVARNFFDSDRTRYKALMNKVLVLDPAFTPEESTLYNFVCRSLGFESAERLALLKRRLRSASRGNP